MLIIKCVKKYFHIYIIFLLTIVCITQYCLYMTTEEHEKLLKRTVQEMRRGNLVLAVLAMLPEKKYGYELLRQMNDLGFGLSQDTLYPLLRRLDEQQLVDSEWVVDETRPRKYYTINKDGRAMLESLAEEWKKQAERLREVIK